MRHNSARTEAADMVVVVGAGLMGVGIAVVFSLAGHRVALIESDPDRLGLALPRVRQALDAEARHKLIDPSEAKAAADRVQCGNDLRSACVPVAAGSSEAVDDASPVPTLVIEAIPEDLALKKRLFADLDRWLPPDTILCTNTSGLSISAIAEGLRHPTRVCGMHFWNPPHLIPLVEVIRGAATSDTTVRRACGLLADAGKTPVVVRKDVPGFVGNRLQHALQREAMSLVAHGIADPEDIDLVVTQGFGRRLGVVGPLAICDLAGLDLVLDVDRYLLRDLEDSPEPSPVLEGLVAAGHIGVATGKGFREWTPEAVVATIARRDAALIAALRADRAREPQPQDPGDAH
jgi:3-hydroxybutyryl-CoA dehydrogenase